MLQVDVLRLPEFVIRSFKNQKIFLHVYAANMRAKPFEDVHLCWVKKNI